MTTLYTAYDLMVALANQRRCEYCDRFAMDGDHVCAACRAAEDAYWQEYEEVQRKRFGVQALLGMDEDCIENDHEWIRLGC